MTREELRQHDEYRVAMKKIRSYTPGFEFTLHYDRMPTPTANALKIVMADAIQEGLLESIAIDLSIDLKQTAETFRRT